MRREDSSRKEAREKRKTRKEEELLKKKEEVKRLKSLKMKEVQAKLERNGREGGKSLAETKGWRACVVIDALMLRDRHSAAGTRSGG